MLFRKSRLIQAEDITNDAGDFWSNVYEPYSRQELPRDVVLKLVDFSRLKGAGNMPKLARLLCACTQPEE